MTGVKFNKSPEGEPGGYDPILAHVIPYSVHDKVGFALFSTPLI